MYYFIFLISSETDSKKIRNPIIQSTNVSIKQALKKIGLQEIGRNSRYYDP